jgi:proteasome accessory factor C
VRGSEWHPDQKQQLNEDGTVELWVPYNDHRELVMDILRYSHEVVVRSPSSLKHEIIKRLKSTQDLYNL